MKFLLISSKFRPDFSLILLFLSICSSFCPQLQNSNMLLSDENRLSPISIAKVHISVLKFNGCHEVILLSNHTRRADQPKSCMMYSLSM